MFAGRIVVLGVLVTLLRLLPPGSIDSPRPAMTDSARAHLPQALGRGSRAQEPNAPVVMRTTVTPASARVGDRLVLRASALVPQRARVRFEPPAAGGAFTWGRPVAGHVYRSHVFVGGVGDLYGVDSCYVEIPVQVFETGKVTLPGVSFVLDGTRAGGAQQRSHTPTVRVLVLPTVTAADSAQGLRPVRGPLGAPWWERVAWRVVIAAALAFAALAGAWWWWARRRRPVRMRMAPAAAVRPARDPAVEALAELARLRAQRLPHAGRFAEHAFQLTRILRRYLEVVLGTPRPGDTSGELLARLGGGALDVTDFTRLESLLSLWDRVKFARAPLDVTEAERCEQAVEVLVRRRLGPREAA